MSKKILLVSLLIAAMALGSYYIIFAGKDKAKTDACCTETKMQKESGNAAAETAMPPHGQGKGSAPGCLTGTKEEFSGKIIELNKDYLVVENEKKMGLKFRLDKESKILTDGKKIFIGKIVTIKYKNLSSSLLAVTISEK
ncbi:MAG: hypothetical protein M1536_06055 [Firmicutes bacterium]|nr:hypothetical protein [Bacillota bacterium]